MDLKLCIIFVIGVVFLSIGVADAIQCYECTTVDSHNCGDPFNPAGVRICNGITCTKGFGSASGKTAITRGCSSDTVEKDECVDVSADAGKVRACVCRSNLCNGGGFAEPTHTINGGGKLQPTYAVLVGLATAILRTINKI